MRINVKDIEINGKNMQKNNNFYKKITFFICKIFKKREKAIPNFNAQQ